MFFNSSAAKYVNYLWIGQKDNVFEDKKSQSNSILWAYLPVSKQVYPHFTKQPKMVTREMLSNKKFFQNRWCNCHSTFLLLSFPKSGISWVGRRWKQGRFHGKKNNIVYRGLKFEGQIWPFGHFWPSHFKSWYTSEGPQKGKRKCAQAVKSVSWCQWHFRSKLGSQPAIWVPS